MKKISTLIITLLVLVTSSCSDFLAEPLQGVYSNATFYKTEAHAQLAMIGVYNAAAFVTTENNLWVFGDVASDDAMKGGASGDLSEAQFIDDFSYVRSNAALDRIWKHYYEGISRANYLLLYGPNIEMDVTLKAKILAEAKFMRAYFYFSLVNIYGNIPLKLDPPLNAGVINKPKSTVTLVYAQIETDLKDAIKSLQKVNKGADLGRASRGSAWGLLAKTYIYQQKWTDALVAIDSVDALGVFSLQKVYKNNFIDSTQNNSEDLFSIEHKINQSPKLGSFLNQYFSPAKDNGYFFNVPVQNFINEFEAVGITPDPRLDYTVGRAGKKWVNGELFDPAWSPTGYLNRKHSQPLREQPIIGDGGLDYVYLRYADILLMKAEALNELNRSGEALTPLNAVRKRARESYLNDKGLTGFGIVPAGLLPDVFTTSQPLLRDAIRHERRVELGFEFHRYFDLMRYGKATAETALGGAFNYETKRYFLIPQSELDTNPMITQ